MFYLLSFTNWAWKHSRNMGKCQTFKADVFRNWRDVCIDNLYGMLAWIYARKSTHSGRRNMTVNFIHVPRIPLPQWAKLWLKRASAKQVSAPKGNWKLSGSTCISVLKESFGLALISAYSIVTKSSQSTGQVTQLKISIQILMKESGHWRPFTWWSSFLLLRIVIVNSSWSTFDRMHQRQMLGTRLDHCLLCNQQFDSVH